MITAPERCWLDPRIVARPSSIEGRGLFAISPIAKGDTVGILGGRVIDDDELGRIAQVRARVIGTRGKTRRIVEELTGAEMSVYGHTIALIGEAFHLAIAREAVEMLLRGSEHNTVYRFLERKRGELKVAQMGF